MKTLKFILLFIISITCHISCETSKNYQNPEDLTAAFFKELKQVKNSEDLFRLRKYFVNKQDVLDFMNKTGESGSFEKLDEEINLSIRTVIAVIAEELLEKQFLQQKVIKIETKYSSDEKGDEQYMKEIMDLLIPLVNEKLKNAVYVSLKRGDSKPVGKLQDKVIIYESPNIAYRIGDFNKEMEIYSIFQTNSGWKMFPLR